MTPEPSQKEPEEAPMTEQMVFNRLPANYFVQDQESMDLDDVVEDLKKMK